MALCVSLRRMIFFPFAPTDLNLLHRLHVESFSSLFSSGHGYCLRRDGANWEWWQSDSVLLHLPSLLICLAFLLIRLILIAVLVWKIYEKFSSVFVYNRCLYAEKRNIVIMLVLWLVEPTPRGIPLTVSVADSFQSVTNSFDQQFYTRGEFESCLCSKIAQKI